MTDDLPRTTFTGLAQRTGLIPDAELDDFWATLEPASIEFMLGEWKGGEFNTGHAINGVLPRANWFGKTMRSATATSSTTSNSRRAGRACGWKSFAVR